MVRTFKIFWAPEGRCIAVVGAKDEKDAKAKTPAPYKQYLGEVYVEEVTK